MAEYHFLGNAQLPKASTPVPSFSTAYSRKLAQAVSFWKIIESILLAMSGWSARIDFTSARFSASTAGSNLLVKMEVMHVFRLSRVDASRFV